jgi:acyl transferase domain-containing protein/acyl carrier protein
MVLHLAQALASRPTAVPLRLVTQGAQVVLASDVARPAQAALWGLGKSIALEHPGLAGGLFDLPHSADSGSTESLRAALTVRDGELEMALRDCQRYVPRLRRIAHEAAARLHLNSAGTYLITGGLGALGLQTAQRLVERGARHLVLVGRRGLPAEATDLDEATRHRLTAVAALKEQGATVHVLAVDVSDREALAEALRVLDDMPPLRGVFHTAGTLDDGVLLNQSRERLAQVFAAKVKGAQHLDELTGSQPLEHFVLFSSVAAVLGSAGQAPYAAANAFLDGLAQRRRSQGLPGLSINWGPWAEAGMAAETLRRDGRRWSVAELLSARTALAALEALAGDSRAQALVLRADWEQAVRTAGQSLPLLAELGIGAAAVDGDLPTRLAQAPPGQRRALLAEQVRTVVGGVLGLAPEAVPAETGFFDLGLDSLMAVELRNRLQRQVGAAVMLSATLLLDQPTLARLTGHLAEWLLDEAAPALAVPARVAEPIAIVGISCRFPGAPDLEAFWELVREGVDAIQEVPAARRELEAAATPETAPRWGGYVDDVERFDAGFFGIAPREAVAIDPQHRQLLETAWEALEHAGQSPAGLLGSRTGVFLGLSGNDYAAVATAGGPTELDPYFAMGSAVSAAAGRLAYTLGLQGPAVVMDTACSSSLVAVHQACHSLADGECELALAGGVNLMLNPLINATLTRARMLSPTGRCKTFDASADGYVRGEGCGMVLLKRLSDAERSGDRVLALIRGSAVNQDGRSGGLTVPNGPAQQAVVRAALAAGGVAAREVEYVEAHGTGTSLGDPIEVQALAAALGDERGSEQPLLIGSVKTNIGHLEAAAGIAGLIKVVLALQHQEIPRHLHMQTPNPHIPWETLPVKVAVESVAWPRGASRRIAGVSSFGFVGTNAHVLIEEAPALPAAPTPTAPEGSHQLLTLSARSPEALRDLAGRYADWLAQHPDASLADVCYTVGIGRSHQEHRAAVVVDSAEQAQRLLMDLQAGRQTPGLFRGNGMMRPKVAWLFPGSNSQYSGMARGLYQTQPLFRQTLDKCADLLAEPRVSALFERVDLLARPAVALPALFAVQMGLARLWQSWGIEPDVLLGQEIGEYAAACVAGVFTMAEGLRLVAQRAAGDAAALSVAYQPAQRTLVCGLTGETLAPGQVLDATYWRRQASESASLGRATAAVVELGCTVLWEIGPEPTLTPGLLAAWPEGMAAPVAIASLRRDRANGLQQCEALAKWYAAGGRIDFAALHQPWPRRKLALPTYPFQRQRYWVERASPRTASTGNGAAPVRLLAEGQLEQLQQRLLRAGTVGQEESAVAQRILTALYQEHERQQAASAIQDCLYQIQWRPAEVAALPDGLDGRGSWLLLADRHGLADGLHRVLEERGQQCEVLRPAEIDLDALQPFAEALARISSAGLPVRGIVHLWSLDLPAACTSQSLGSMRDLALRSTLALVQALAQQPWTAPVHLVTRAAQAVVPGDEVQPTQAPLWGLGKVLCLEMPQLGGRLVDLPAEVDVSLAVGLLGALLADDSEDQAALRQGKRHVPRLVRRQAGSEAAPLPVQATASYLITGGLGALGLHVAGWLARRGARHLALVARRPPQEASLEVIRQLQETWGCRVRVYQADVSQVDAVARLLTQVQEDLPPLKGVMHAAGVPGVALLASLTADELDKVLRAKVQGAWNLHVGTVLLGLDFFVSFSSITAVWGSRGQGHYAAANAFLDGLAHYQRSIGNAGIAINWGPWADGGMANDQAQQWLRQSGVRALAPARALAGMDILGQKEMVPVVMADIDWPTFLGVFQARGRRPLLAELEAEAVQAVSAPGAGELRAQLEQVPAGQRRRLLQEHVRETIGAVLRLPPAGIDLRTGFFELGMDSLMAVELRNRLQAELGGAPLDSTVVFDHPTVEALAEHLAQQMWGSAVPAPVHREAPMPTAEPIAIVGLACRFPGGEGPEAFWQLLAEGREAVRDVPPDRWDIGAYYDPNPDAPGKMYVRRGALLKRIDQFDSAFFGIAPREAVGLDPQQRLLLETAWEALEQAGLSAEKLSGGRTGVYVGICGSDYAGLLLRRGEEGIDAYLGTGTSPAAAAGRLSYALGLQGPCVAIDTACSSSLVAVSQACDALRAGRCDAALVGGVNAMVMPEATIAACKARMLSPAGRCKTFDASADGYVRGEGCGMVVLKRLSDAQRDGDRILALIRGSAVNQDGRSGGLTVPNGPAQQAVICEALAAGGVAPHEVGYVEAHGTGTSLGDPIEVQALAAALGEGRDRNELIIIGSVKTNIGHLEGAAGIAGLIKVVLALVHEEIPRHLHFQNPNPHIPWEALPVKVAVEPVPWRRGQRRRIAGVSSFGFSGTNAHVVLEEAPELPAAPPAAPPDGAHHLLTLSARSPQALDDLAGRYTDWLAQHPDAPLADVCYTAGIGRSHHEQRAALVADSAEQAQSLLADLQAGRQTPGLFRGARMTRPMLAWLFPGHDCMYPGIARELYETHPVFRRTLDECAELLNEPLVTALFERSNLLAQPSHASKAFFAVQLGLARLWQSWGIEPDVLLGQEIGEYAAACVAGVFTTAEGLRLVAQRAASADAGALSLAYEPAQRTLVCSLTGETLAPGQVLDATYWRRQAREPAALARATATLAELGCTVLCEIGPGPTLTPAVLEAWPERAAAPVVLGSLRRDTADGRQLVEALAAWYTAGGRIDFAAFHQPWPRRKLALPTYPFQRQRYWVERANPRPTPSVNDTAAVQLLSEGHLDQLHQHLLQAGALGQEESAMAQRVLQALYQEHERQQAASAIQDCLYQVEWRPAAVGAHPDEPASEGSWLLLADGHGLADGLCQLLQQRGQQCHMLRPSENDLDDPQPFAKPLARLADTGLPVRGIVHLWSLDLPPTCNNEALATMERLALRSTLVLVQALAQQQWTAPVHLVTRAAQTIRSADRVEPAQTPLWGLAKVLRLEMPQFAGSLVDLPAEVDASLATALLEVLLANDSEDQAALRQGQRHVPRLVRRQVGSVAAPLPVQASATYLITGGLGALGLQVAGWLARRGARHLALVGRRPPPQDGALEAIRHLQDTWACRVQVYQADVGQADAVARLLAQVQEDLPPLKGVIHAAGVLGVAPLTSLSVDELDTVLSAKVQGAWNLHSGTASAGLDFFMSFSSIAAVWGSRGQGHYAAANAFLDGLAHYQRSVGVAGIAINWGPWAGGGMANDQAQQWLRQNGVRALAPARALAGMDILGQKETAPVVVADIDWPTFLGVFQARGRRPLVAELEAEAARGVPAPDAGELRTRLEQAPSSQRRRLLQEHLQEVAGKVLRLPAAQVDPRAGFFELGMDSLMAVELRRRLEAELGCPLPATVAMDQPRIVDLAGYILADVLRLEEQSDRRPSSPATKNLEERIAGLTDDEVAAMLDAELGDLPGGAQ